MTICARTEVNQSRKHRQEKLNDTHVDSVGTILVRQSDGLVILAFKLREQSLEQVSQPSQFQDDCATPEGRTYSNRRLQHVGDLDLLPLSLCQTSEFELVHAVRDRLGRDVHGVAEVERGCKEAQDPGLSVRVPEL